MQNLRGRQLTSANHSRGRTTGLIFPVCLGGEKKIKKQTLRFMVDQATISTIILPKGTCLTD